MLETLRPAEYIGYRDAAVTIFDRFDGPAAVDAFGISELLTTDAAREDPAPVLAFLEAQGYRGTTTDTLGRLGLAGLRGELPALFHDRTVLLGSMIGLGPAVAVPGWSAQASVAFDVAGSGLMLLDDPSSAARPADEADDYMTVLDLEEMPATVLVPDDRVAGIRETLLARTQLGAAAEMLGVCDRILEQALEYVRSRRQFGQAIGSFQAVQHGLAWAATDRHQLACLYDYAVTSAALVEPDPQLALAVKAMAGRVVHSVIQAVTQATGAISFTWEYSLNRFHRRSLALDQLAGASGDLVAGMGRQLRIENTLPDLLQLSALVD